MNSLDMADHEAPRGGSGSTATDCSSSSSAAAAVSKAPSQHPESSSSSNSASLFADNSADSGRVACSLPTPSAEAFLPLAALAPPPIGQPAWLIAQQQQARLQNEHFPARIFGTRSSSASSGGGGEHPAGGSDIGGCVVGAARGRGGDDNSSINSNREQSYEYDFEYPRQRSFSSAGSGGCTSVAADRLRSPQGAAGGAPAPPPGFGSVPPGMMDHHQQHHHQQHRQGRVRSSSLSKEASSNGGGGGGGRGTPHHLDESWTAVLNSPAGSELMEFLTERASRALVLWNVEAIRKDELRAACEAYGPLYYLRTEHGRKRVVFLAYYDVRDAVNAHQFLGAELSQRLINDVSGFSTDRFIIYSNINTTSIYIIFIAL